MKKEETIIQDAIIKYLKEQKVLHWRMSGASNLSGFPDLLVCFQGYFVAFEIKTPTGSPTAQQHKVLADIISAGGYGVLVKSVKDVERILLHIKELKCLNL